MACLLQALEKIKDLIRGQSNGKDGKIHLEAMVVEDFAVPWEPFIGYLKDSSNYQNIDYDIGNFMCNY